MARRVITDDDLYPVPHQGGAPPAPPAAPGYPVGPVAEPPQPWQVVDTTAPLAAERSKGNRAMLIVGVIIAVTLAGVAGFFGGRASRPSDAAIAQETKRAAESAAEKMRIQADGELKKARAEAQRSKDRAVARAESKARNDGRNAGLAQGRAEGTAEGTAQGRDIGRQEGLSTNLCYDVGTPYSC
ncbi:MAG: hypothetical protein JHD16_01220 [Solirubrobacteraceae bacterium]|nr:hypothetical protein [Solirubrobacteraceae bacterium]